MKYILFAMLFIFANSGAAADPCDTLHVGQLTRANIKALVEDHHCQIFSPDDLLNKIPQGYFANYALAYQSRSLQGPYEIDYLNPRAIVYGTTEKNFSFVPAKNRLIFSFNGKPGQAGYKAVEFVEMDQTGGQDGHQYFKYFEVDWPKFGDIPRVSAYNPPKCVACHGNPARPIFAVYPRWEGFYGSSVFDQAQNNFEAGKYKDFVEYAKTHPRYRHLTQSISLAAYDGTMDPALSAEGLETSLEFYNDKRVARLIRETPQYKLARYAIAGALSSNRCGKWSDFLPPRVLAELEANLSRRHNYSAAETDQALRQILNPPTDDYRDLNLYQQSAAKIKTILSEIMGPDPFLLDLAINTLKTQGPAHDGLGMTGIRILMEGRGLEIGSWYLELTEPTYRVHTVDQWLEGLMAQDPELGEFRALKSNERSSSQNACDELRRKSLAAMQNFKVPYITAKAAHQRGIYPQTFVNTCALCHALPDGERGDIPAIPYDDPGQLEAFLTRYPQIRAKIWTKINNPEGFQMPPYRMLSPDEIESIGEYLKRWH